MAKYVHLELIQVKYMQIIKIPAKHKIEKKKKKKKKKKRKKNISTFTW